MILVVDSMLRIRKTLNKNDLNVKVMFCQIIAFLICVISLIAITITQFTGVWVFVFYIS